MATLLFRRGRSRMGQVITQVDAFTDRPFAGNPAYTVKM